jgi:exonuclease III
MYRNCKNVSIMSFNIQSISSKFAEFKDLIDIFSQADCAPDVICLQELWKFPQYANFSLPGYNHLELHIICFRTPF